jgi:outer membrane protein OmpA-like peptidoglycan-associated protein
MRKIIAYSAAAVFLILFSAHAAAEPFQFKYHEGEKYRILSKVDQNVFIDGTFHHQAQILNRIAVEVAKVEGDAGFLKADFRTSEEATDRVSVFTWGQHYYSEYWRDRLGHYDIADSYFMPVVRNVPVFPERDIEVGETWSAIGSEAHDFRDTFGLSEPLRFPIPVVYTYLGEKEKDGKEWDHIEIRYNVFHKPEQITNSTLYPVRITGFSHQFLFWDNVRGRPYAYEEEYSFVFSMSNGSSIEWTGTAEAKVIESSVMDKDLVAQQVEEDIITLGIEDTEVETTDLGVTLRMENIQFLPDSAVLLESEKDKLRRIAGILKKYPERDILITGHTALAGTAEGRKVLSQERAAAVGQYLLALGVRDRERLITRGVGAREPRADNSTETGRRKNRRVEITILEN